MTQQTDRDLKAELDSLDSFETAPTDLAWPQSAPENGAVKALGVENLIAQEVEETRQSVKQEAEKSFLSNFFDNVVSTVRDYRGPLADDFEKNMPGGLPIPGGIEGLDFIARRTTGVAPTDAITGNVDEFTKGQNRGFYNTMSSFAGGVEQYGKTLGSETITGYAGERKEAFKGKAEKPYFKPRIEGMKDISKEAWFSDTLDYVISSAGEGMGSSGPFIGVGAVGGTPAMLGFGYTSSVGELRDELIANGVTDEATVQKYSYIAAFPHAILDQLTEMGLFKGLTQEARKEVTKGVVSLVLSGAGKGAVKEGATEAAQRIIELGTVAHAKGGEAPNAAVVAAVFSDLGQGVESTILESGVKGAIPGTVFGVGEVAGQQMKPVQESRARTPNTATDATPVAPADTRAVAPMMEGPAQKGMPGANSEPATFSEPELEAARKAIQDAAQGLPVEMAPEGQPGAEQPQAAPSSEIQGQENEIVPEQTDAVQSDAVTTAPTDEELDIPAVFAEIEDYLAENKIQIDELADEAVREVAQAVYQGEDLGVAVDRALGLEEAAPAVDPDRQRRLDARAAATDSAPLDASKIGTDFRDRAQAKFETMPERDRDTSGETPEQARARRLENRAAATGSRTIQYPAVVRQKFAEVLASTTPRSKWAEASGVDPETLNTLIDEAVADGRMEIRFGKPVRKAAARVAPVKPQRPATRTMSRAEEMRVDAIKNSTARTYAQRLLEATDATEVDAAITAMQRNKKVSKAVLKEVVRAYGGVRGAPSSTRAAYTMIRNIAASRAPAAEQAPVQTAAQSPAPTPQAAATAPAPAPEPQERRISIITPDGSMEMTGTVEIVELDSLKAATGAMQPRDRSRKESDNQKRNIAANLDPQQLLPSRVSDTGAPLTTSDGTVISGNGRVGALDIVYTDPALADKAAAYRQAIGAPAGMKKPVMVVRMSPRATPEELTRFADLSNRSRIASLSATERAMRDARAAGMDIMGLYTGGAFTSVENREFFRAFTQLIPPNELNSFSKNGVLTKEGDDRLSASVLAAAYGDPDMLSRMLEDADDDIRSITGAMRDAAGAFIRLKSAIRNGQASIKFDITPQVAEVAKRIADLRARNIKPRAFLDQQDAFNQIDPIVEALLVAFYNDNLSRQLRREKITEILVRYADEAAKHNEGGLFEDTTTPREIVTTARTRALEGERLAATQQDFFAPSPSPAGRSDAGTSGTGSGQAPDGRGANADRQAATAGDVDAPSRNANLERDWRDGPPQDGLGQADVPAAAGADVTGSEPGGETAVAEGQANSGVGVPDGDAAAMGGGRDSAVQGGTPGDGLRPAGRGKRAGSGDAGSTGVPAGRLSTETVGKAAANAANLAREIEAQRVADATVPFVLNDADNIRAALPMLRPAGREDVIKAEARFSQPNGNGFLFTNGTGTGKTFVGLGVAKRFIAQGKTNILIVAPSQGILDGWIAAGKMLNVEVTRLDDTKTAGTGVVATTYANLRENAALADRDWDLIIPDEAHHLSQNQSGSPSDALAAFRGLSGYSPASRANVKLRPLTDEIARLKAAKKTLDTDQFDGEIDRLTEEYAARHRELTEFFKTKPRAKALFLSATPFAYRKNTDWAEGFLFDYPEEKGGYNNRGGQSEFLVTNFGYKMRYGRAEEPGPEVNTGFMEREFYERLKREGVLSGRRLEVEADYDRRFVLVDDAIGAKIDQALEWLRTEGGGRYRYSPLAEAFMKRFDYLSQRRLLEAIKAKHVIERIQRDLELGRKIVVFHDYNEGGGSNPFAMPDNPNERGYSRYGEPEQASLGELYSDFIRANPYVKRLNFSQFRSPIETLTEAFPNAMVYNGTIPNKKRAAARDAFNKDGSGKDIIIVQSAAGEAGISLHDTTGQHQRVLYNLGLPTRPTTAIQQEGRIYRDGQVSDAILRYMSTGTSWERRAFAQTIAERASTAENLALGDEARALRDAFIDAFNEADEIQQGPEEGKGGKTRDRTMGGTVSAYERAKAFYFAQGKVSGRRDQREGKDYFATPEPIGLKMVEFADVRNGERVLEPSAGHGAIARWFPEGADRVLIEPSGSLSSRAGLASPGAKVITSRFEDHYIGNKYDAIVMNPPFGVGGKDAFDHIQKAVGHLREGGRIVAIVPRGPAADKRLEAFRDDDANKNIYTAMEIEMPGVMFERAGTRVATRILVLEKHADPATAPYQFYRDLSDAETITELFDRMEDLSLSERSRGENRPAVRAAAPPQPTPEQPAAVAVQQPATAAQPVAAPIQTAEPAPVAAPTPPSAPTLAAATKPGKVPGTKFKFAEVKHGKTGADLFVASIAQFVQRPVYEQLRDIAKTHNGYYSTFKGRGAVPGFQFPSEADRTAFVQEVLGAPEAAPAAPQAQANRLPRKGDIIRVVDIGSDWTKLKADIKMAQPFSTVDQMLELAAVAHEKLTALGKKIGAALGITYKAPKLKGRERIVEKLDGSDPRFITDAARGGFEVETVEQSERIVAELAKEFGVVDEGWSVTESGYFDRKIMVRFDNGIAGEVQVWPPGMYKAKAEKGQDLYTEARRPSTSPEDRERLNAQQRELYAAVVKDMAMDFQELAANKASAAAMSKSGYLAANASRESIGTSRSGARMMGAADPTSTLPVSESTNTAFSSVMTAGPPSLSKYPNFMGKSSEKDIGETGENVQSNAPSVAPVSVKDFAQSVADLKDRISKEEPRSKLIQDDVVDLEEVSLSIREFLPAVAEPVEGGRLPKVQEATQTFVAGLTDVVTVARQQEAVDTTNATYDDLDVFTDALDDLDGIIEDKLQEGYEVDDELSTYESSLIDAIDEIESEYETLSTDAETEIGFLNDIWEGISDRLPAEPEDDGTETTAVSTDVKRVMDDLPEWTPNKNLIDEARKEIEWLKEKWQPIYDRGNEVWGVDTDEMTDAELIAYAKEVEDISDEMVRFKWHADFMVKQVAEKGRPSIEQSLGALRDEVLKPTMDELTDLQISLQARRNAEVDRMNAMDEDGEATDEGDVTAALAGKEPSFAEAAMPSDVGANARTIALPAPLRVHARALFAAGLDQDALNKAITALEKDRALAPKDRAAVAEAYVGGYVNPKVPSREIRKAFAERVHDVSLAELGGFDPSVSGSNLDWRPEARAALSEMAARLPEGTGFTVRNFIEIATRSASMRQIGLEIEGGMFTPEQAERQLDIQRAYRKVMAISLAYGPDVALQTFTHEEIHAVREFLTDKEWGVLSKLATRKPKKSEALRLIDIVETNGKVTPQHAEFLRANAGTLTYREIYGIDQRYGRLNLSEDKLVEEVVAHAAADWADGHDFGTRIERVMMKIRDLIEALGNLLKGQGFETVDSIFNSIWSGEVAKRAAAAEPQPKTILDTGLGGVPLAASIAGWHGTPHNVDKFSKSRIGTGEGAQAFGKGLYFAQNPDVADWYRKKLAARKNGGMSTRNPASWLPPWRWTAQEYALDFLYQAFVSSDRTTYKKNALRAVDRQILHYEMNANVGLIKRWLDKENVETAKYYLEKMKAAREAITSGKVDLPQDILNTTGNIYKVDIDADQQHFIDLGKTVGEQSEYVKKALMEGGILEGYENVSARAYFGREDELEQLGIAGFIYLDGQSRKDGTGNYNFVVFDEDIIKIVEVNGEPVDDLEGAMFSIAGLHASKYDFSKFDDARVGTGVDAARSDKTGVYGPGHYITMSNDKADLYKGSFGADGRVYTVEILREPNEFLNWHAPLAQQGALGAKVADAIAARGTMTREEALRLRRGEDVMFALGAGGQQHYKAAAAEALKNLGVAGIAYTDTIDNFKSRHWDFVVYNGSDIRITHVDGKATPQTMDAYGAMFSLAGEYGSGKGGKIKAWHSTPAKFDKFDNRYTDEVGFHFGTKMQAHNRAYIMSGGNLWKYFRNWRDIPVEMDIQNPVRISDDPGSFMPTKLAQQLVKDGIAPYELIAQVQDAQLGPTGSPEAAKSIVRDFLLSKGYDAIEYPNTFEDAGGMSYMTLGTGNVRNVNTGEVVYSLAGDQNGTDVATLNQAIDSLKNALGIQVTQNLFGVTIKAGKRKVRINPRSNILGQTSRTTGGVGVRRSRDIKAIAHEGGHSLELMLGSSLANLKAKFTDALTTPFAPDLPMPKNLRPVGFSGLELDDVEQKALIEAVTTKAALMDMTKQVGALKAAPRMIGRATYDEEAYRRSENAAGAARANLIRLVGKTRADALVDEVERKTPPDVPTFVQERFSPMGAPKRRTTTAPSGEALSEAFARWFEKYTMSRESAFDMAPGFFEAFEDLLEAEAPSVLEGLHTVQEQYKAWTKRATVEDLSSDVVSVTAKNTWSDIRDGRKGFSDKITGWTAEAYTGVIDDLSPVQQMVRRLLAVADRNGVKDDQGRPISLKVSENPYKIARMFRGSYATGYTWIKDGIPNHGEEKVIYPGLQKAMETIFGQDTYDEPTYRAFGQYLISKRAIAEYDRLAAKKGRLADIASIIEQGTNAWRMHSTEQAKERDILDRRQAALDRVNVLVTDRTRALGAARTAERKAQERIQELRDDLAEALRAIDDGSDVARATRDRRRRSLQMAERNARDVRNDVVDLEMELQGLTTDQAMLKAEIEQRTAKVEQRQATLSALESSIALMRREQDATSKRGASRPPTLEAKEWHEEFLAKVARDNKFAKFEEAAQIVYGFTQGLLTVRYQAGLIPEKLYQELSSRKGWYVPLMRDMSDAPAESVFTGGGVKSWSPFKKFDGSDRAIINPLEILSQESYAAAQHIALNEAVGALAALAQKAGQGSANIAELMERTEDLENNPETFTRIRDIAISMGIDEADATLMAQRMETNFANEDLQAIWSPGSKGPMAEPTLPLWQNGERKHVALRDPEFAADIMQSMMGLGKEQMSWAMELLGKPARLLQLGVTTHPTFMPRNLVRDVFDAWIKTGALPIVTQVKGARELYKKDGEFLRQYTAAGGILGGRNIAALTSKEQQANVMDMDPRKFRLGSALLGTGALGITGAIMGGPLGGIAGATIGFAGSKNGGLLKMVEAIESMTRLGVAAHAYDRAKIHNPNLTEQEAMLEAAFVARDVFDWNRRGSKTLALVRMITFLNAQIQGLDRAARAVSGSGDRGSAVAKQLTAVFRREHDIPLSMDEQRDLGEAYKTWARLGLYTALLLSLYAMYRDDDRYEDIKDGTKATHSWLPGFLGVDVRLPKAFEWAIPANFVEILWDKMEGRDPNVGERWRKSAQEVIVPPGVPQAFNLMAGYTMNTDLQSIAPWLFGESADVVNRKIVPDELKKLAPEAQFDAFTSQLSKDIALAMAKAGLPEAAIPSPKMIDFTLRTGGYWGQDIQKGYQIIKESAGSPAGPQPRVPDLPVVGGFTGVAARQSKSVEMLYRMMSQQGGDFTTAAYTYKNLMDKSGNPAEAESFLNRLEPEARAYAILNYNFTAADKRRHPLERASAMAKISRDIRKEIVLDRLAPQMKEGRKTVYDFDNKIDLPPAVKTQVTEIMERLAQAESWNGFVVLGRPGWEGKNVIETKPILAELKAAAPDVFELYEGRVEKAKIEDFETIQKDWPKMREELLRNGADANF